MRCRSSVPCLLPSCVAVAIAAMTLILGSIRRPRRRRPARASRCRRRSPTSWLPNGTSTSSKNAMRLPSGDQTGTPPVADAALAVEESGRIRAVGPDHPDLEREVAGRTRRSKVGDPRAVRRPRWLPACATVIDEDAAVRSIRADDDDAAVGCQYEPRPIGRPRQVMVLDGSDPRDRGGMPGCEIDDGDARRRRRDRDRGAIRRPRQRRDPVDRREARSFARCWIEQHELCEARASGRERELVSSR